jgi:hypothetical protein
MGHKKAGHSNNMGKQGAPHVWSKCLVNVANKCLLWHNKNTEKKVDCCNRCFQSIIDGDKRDDIAGK